MALSGVLVFAVIRLIDTTPAAQALLVPNLFAADPVTQLSVPGIEESACISSPPTRGRLGRTVFVDAGHGGLDPGVVGAPAGGRHVLEKDATLAVATRLTALLRADGYRVVMARTQDTSVVKLAGGDITAAGSISSDAEHRDLAARAACANAANASVLLSIHFDAFSDPLVGGTETFYDAARPFADANRRLASALQAAMVVGLGEPDRGVWTDDQLAAPTLTASGRDYGHLIELGPAAAGWVDSPSEMPGALVEPLFLTDPAESRLAADPAGQQKIAVALEAGLVQFLGVAG
jgi:N-acetylmuramoyl-L-alanine amidase